MELPWFGAQADDETVIGSLRRPQASNKAAGRQPHVLDENIQNDSREQ